MRSANSFLAFFAAAALAACGGSDSPTGSTGGVTPTPTATTPSISIDSGFADRTAVVGSTVPASVHVAVNGVPTSGITVTWSVSTGGGTVNPTTSVSDASGLATTSWTLNDTVRVATLTAAVLNASSVSMFMTTFGGAASTFTKVTADSVAVVAGASTLLTVRVKDKSGNPVTGTTVTWTTTGGALTTSSTTTGSSGNGQVVFSTDPTPKSYTVTATAAGLGVLTFKVVGL
jgi:Bacterial Ig-like domain (group 1)